VLLTRALNCWVAADVRVAVVGETVTTTLGALATVIPKDCEPECACRSAAEIVKVKVPAWLGVPERIPVALARTRPVGSCPEETVKW
jgi:hypothetical protein